MRFPSKLWNFTIKKKGFNCVAHEHACSCICPQGGFDIPERMFYSIKKEWDSSSRDNMGDVRELIPEFFYLPDFLLNSNNIQLGWEQNTLC